MRGCRPLSPAEDLAVQRALVRGREETRWRDLVLWLAMSRAGLRVSEAMALRVGDVLGPRGVRSHIALRRAGTKGSVAGSSLPVHPRLARALRVYLRRSELDRAQPDSPLFPSSQVGMASRPALTRNGAWRVIRRALDEAGIDGPSGCHSGRKSFAARVYVGLGHDLIATQAAMRHRSLTSTVAYLSPDRSRIEAAIRGV